MQNTNNGGSGSYITFKTTMVTTMSSWNNATAVFTVRNLFKHQDLGTFTGSYTEYIEPSSVGMYKMVLVM